MHADSLKIPEGLEKIAGHIESAMEGDLKRSGKIDKLFRAPGIDLSVQIQNPQDNPIGTEFLRHKDIALHDLEFILRIAEIRVTRANHDVQGNSDLLADRGDEAGTRSNPTVGEDAAEFNAVRTAPLSSQSGFDRIHTHFKSHSVARDAFHGCTLCLAQAGPRLYRPAPPFP